MSFAQIQLCVAVTDSNGWVGSHKRILAVGLLVPASSPCFISCHCTTAFVLEDLCCHNRTAFLHFALLGPKISLSANSDFSLLQSVLQGNVAIDKQISHRHPGSYRNCGHDFQEKQSCGRSRKAQAEQVWQAMLLQTKWTQRKPMASY